MKKLAIGCGIVALVLFVGAGVGGYILYNKARGYVAGMKETVEALSSFSKYADSVENRTPFTPPSNGELTVESMRRFANVQAAMRVKMGPKFDQVAAMQDDMMKREQAEHRKSTAIEDFQNVTAMMKFLVEGLAAWAEALNQEHFSVDEYYWVRGRVYAAAGQHITEIALRNAPDTVKAGGNLIGPMAGATGPVPPHNRQIVAPYLPNMKDWAKMAFFGL